MDDKLFAKGQKEELLGEAYFLRALTYYNVATIWGNAPLMIESIESSSQVITANNELVNTPDQRIYRSWTMFWLTLQKL